MEPYLSFLSSPYGLIATVAVALIFKMLRTLRKLILFLAAVGVFFAVANTVFADPMTAGKAFAESLKGSVNSAAVSTNPENVPNYQGQNVPEVQYYSSGGAIEDQARLKAANDPTAEFVSEARYSRPQFDIDRETDPLFLRHGEIEGMANSLTSTYQGCVELPVGTENKTDQTEDSCTVTGYQERTTFQCNLTRLATCGNPLAGQPVPLNVDYFEIVGPSDLSVRRLNQDTFEFYTPNSGRTGSCTEHVNTVRFYIEDASEIRTSGELQIPSFTFDDGMNIYMNGALVVSAYQNRSSHLGRVTPTGTGGTTCEANWTFPYNNPLDLRSRVRNGWNEIEIRHLVGGRGHYNLNLKISVTHGCEPEFDQRRTCPVGKAPTGQPVNERCLDGPGSKQVQGFPVWHECWDLRETYEQLSDPIFDQDVKCQQLEEAGCGMTTSFCEQHNGFFCERQRIGYVCSSESPARTVTLCGDQLLCPDGACANEYQDYEDATDDFIRAATSMAIADEISKYFDFDTVSVFAGVGKSCKDDMLGWKKCCKDGGWGTDIGLAQCSTEEKELGLDKEAGSTVYVGSRDSTNSLGVTTSTTKTYCSYPSKLARIIVQQGNQVLGRGYGSARSPVCSGFTIEELESLDFEEMNLSEFFQDVQAAAINSPFVNPSAVAADLKQKIEQMGGQQ